MLRSRLHNAWNFAGGMNNKARTDDWRVKLAFPIFLLIDVVLKTEILASRLFTNFRTAENVRGVLQNVYVNSDAVDDELVDLICKPGAPDPQLSSAKCAARRRMVLHIMAKHFKRLGARASRALSRVGVSRV